MRRYRNNEPEPTPDGGEGGDTGTEGGDGTDAE